MNVLPPGWTAKGLLDLAVIRSGQVDPRQPKYRDMPLIAPDHIEVGTGRLIAVRSAREQGAVSGKYMVDPGDVIYSKIRPYLMKAHRAHFPALCSADMYPLKPRAGVDGRYLHSVLLGRRFTNFAVGESMRSGIPKVNREALAGYELPVPPGPEQREIGDALSDADELIESLERLTAKKRDVKQGLMQELLSGRTRLPGFTGKWREVTLGEIAKIKTGKRNNQDNVPGGRYPFFVRSATVERIDSYSYDGEAILIPGEGGIGSIFHYMNGKFEVHQRVYKVSDFVATCGKYVFYYMSQFFGSHALEGSVKATVDSLRLPTFKSFVLRLPDQLDEQEAIAAALGNADAEIEALERRLESARAVKVGMMQELLTGRTRLPVEEEG